MFWKNWTDWKKGALIGPMLFLLILIINLPFSLMFTESLCNDLPIINCDDIGLLGHLLIFILSLVLIAIISSIIGWVIGKILHSSKSPPWTKSIIIGFIIGFFIGITFLSKILWLAGFIGALIGWIIWKIRSKKRTPLSPSGQNNSTTL